MEGDNNTFFDIYCFTFIKDVFSGYLRSEMPHKKDSCRIDV